MVFSGWLLKFISSNAELILTWHQGKQNTLLFQGKDGNLVRDKFVSLCRAQSCTSKPSHGQEQALSIDSGTSMPSKDVVSKSVQVCQDSLQNYSINCLSNCRCSCGVLAADVEGVKLDIAILQSRIELLSESKNELSHKEKDKEIDRLRGELMSEKRKSERLESELCLFVRERSVEIGKSNQLILSLENKITKLEEINDSLKSATKLSMRENVNVNQDREYPVDHKNDRLNTKLAFCVTEVQSNLDSSNVGTFDSSVNGYKESLPNVEPFHTELNNLKESDPLLHETVRKQNSIHTNQRNGSLVKQAYYSQMSNQCIPTRITSRKQPKRTYKNFNRSPEKYDSLSTAYYARNDASLQRRKQPRNHKSVSHGNQQLDQVFRAHTRRRDKVKYFRYYY